MRSETRADPRVEARDAIALLGRALLCAATAAVVFAVRVYWPDEWSFDAAGEDRTSFVVVYGVLGVLGVCFLVAGLDRARRWREALRWERLLADPATAHLVPPLRSHVATVRPGAAGSFWMACCVLSVLLAVGFIAYGALALTGRVPAYRDSEGEDRSEALFAFGALFVLLTLYMARRLRRSRVARTVERLAADSAIAPLPQFVADVAARRSASIPALDVIFEGEEATLRHRAITRRHGRAESDPLHILYLRVFDNAAGTTRFVRSPWRFHGYIHLLRSAEQVDADELEAAKDSGSVASLFISTPAELDAALARQATGRDPEPRPKGLIKTWRWFLDLGRYPVRALLCGGGFWKSAIDLLLARMDLVVLDLAGYHPQHAGTRYELQRLVDCYPIDRVMLLAERTSDRRFLTAQIQAAWAQMAERSPNAGTGSRSVRVAVDLDHLVPTTYASQASTARDV